MYDNLGSGTVASSLALSNMKLWPPVVKCSGLDGRIAKVAADSAACNRRDRTTSALKFESALVVEAFS
jgi:hypothetical protein